jgi:hypothetical protein
MTEHNSTRTAQQTFFVRCARWDGTSDAIMSCTSQAEAEAFVHKLNSERDDAPYYWDSRG